jgi:hypothetical protein
VNTGRDLLASRISGFDPNLDIDAHILFAFARFTFEGKFVGDTPSHSGKGVARYTW